MYYSSLCINYYYLNIISQSEPVCIKKNIHSMICFCYVMDNIVFELNLQEEQTEERGEEEQEEREQNNGEEDEDDQLRTVKL